MNIITAISKNVFILSGRERTWWQDIIWWNLFPLNFNYNDLNYFAFLNLPVKRFSTLWSLSFFNNVPPLSPFSTICIFPLLHFSYQTSGILIFLVNFTNSSYCSLPYGNNLKSIHFLLISPFFFVQYLIQIFHRSFFSCIGASVHVLFKFRFFPFRSFLFLYRIYSVRKFFYASSSTFLSCSLKLIMSYT